MATNYISPIKFTDEKVLITDKLMKIDKTLICQKRKIYEQYMLPVTSKGAETLILS